MTPAVRQLEKAGITHRILSYDSDPAARSYGEEACSRLGLEPAVVFKTLLVQPSEGSLAVAVVPVLAKLDLKAVAKALGAKRAVMADPAAAERSTGYVVGGISPFGQRRRLATLVDDAARELDVMYVSGGRRGLELAISPSALTDVLGARFAPLCAA